MFWRSSVGCFDHFPFVLGLLISPTLQIRSYIRMSDEQCQPVVGIIGMGDVRILHYHFPPPGLFFELMKRAIDGADVCKTITCGRHQDVSLFKEDPI